MDTREIINQLADEADDLLAHVLDEREARAVLEERINTDHSTMKAPDKAKVIQGVLDILHEEEFFRGAPRKSMLDPGSVGENEV